MGRGLGSWDVVRRVAEEEIGEWLAAQRSQGYRAPIERALLWRFVPSRAAVPAYDREWVERVFHEQGWAAQRIEPSRFQRLLELEAHGSPYYALEWIEAVPLRRALADGGALPASVALGVVTSLCESVAALHGLRADDGTPLAMIARCVDPESIWVTPAGELRMANPVVASRLAFRPDDQPLDPRSFDFFAPELVRGRMPELESDVFQLGLLAVALLLGRWPLLRDTPMETLRAVATVDVEPTDWARLPEALRAVLLRALEREPNKRPASARELGVQLDYAARASEIAIAPPEPALADRVRGLPTEVCGVRAGAARIAP